MAGNPHPLDIDLLADANGEPVDGVPDVGAHVEACLVCRIRTGRLRAAGPYQRPGPAALEGTALVPRAVLDVLDTTAAAPEPAPGQLWLAGEPERALVWLMDVGVSEAVACPVTLDTDIADSETLLVAASPLDLSLGVLTGVTGRVPLDALSRFVGDLPVGDEVAALRARPEPGGPTDLSVGPPVLTSTDERLEHRQLLADGLAALGPPSDHDGGDGLPPAAQVRSSSRPGLYRAVEEEMDVRRGPRCSVQAYADPRLLAIGRPLAWEPLALVSELTSAILVVGCDVVGPAIVEHAEAAKRLLDESHATALAFAERHDPHHTDIFEGADLATAFEVPSGELVAPRARQVSMPVADALFKYLDEAVIVVGEPTHLPMIAPRRDLWSVMERALAEQIEVVCSATATIPAKVEARDSLRDEGSKQLAGPLRRAAEGGGDLIHEVARVAKR